jgi:hypothetical protein
MKKLWKKFKSWLIRKLGGYEAEIFEVKRTYLPAITIESRIALNHFANFTTEQITEELCHKLADGIAPYIGIVKDEDPMNFPFSDIYIGRIKIVKED